MCIYLIMPESQVQIRDIALNCAIFTVVFVIHVVKVSAETWKHCSAYHNYPVHTKQKVELVLSGCLQTSVYDWGYHWMLNFEHESERESEHEPET